VRQWSPDRKTQGKETYKCDQGDSEFANLLDDTLCCTIGPSHDDAIVGPTDIEDATYCLQDVEYEKGELQCKSIN
jgi:hypothetical protein